MKYSYVALKLLIGSAGLANAEIALAQVAPAHLWRVDEIAKAEPTRTADPPSYLPVMPSEVTSEPATISSYDDAEGIQQVVNPSKNAVASASLWGLEAIGPKIDKKVQFVDVGGARRSNAENFVDVKVASSGSVLLAPITDPLVIPSPPEASSPKLAIEIAPNASRKRLSAVAGHKHLPRVLEPIVVASKHGSVGTNSLAIITAAATGIDNPASSAAEIALSKMDVSEVNARKVLAMSNSPDIQVLPNVIRLSANAHSSRSSRHDQSAKIDRRNPATEVASLDEKVPSPNPSRPPPPLVPDEFWVRSRKDLFANVIA